MRFFSKKYSATNKLSHYLLLVELPPAKSQSGSTEHFLASLHDILMSNRKSQFSGSLQEHISLEIRAGAGQIKYYIWLPTQFRELIEEQIAVTYPGTSLKEEINDYSSPARKGSIIDSGELALTGNELLPIVNPGKFSVEHFNALIHTLNSIDKNGEEIWLQILLRPLSDNWKLKARKLVSRLSRDSDPASDTYKKALAIEEKVSYPGYRVKIRLLCTSADQRSARLRLESVAATFKHFNNINPNGFNLKSLSSKPDRQLEYYTRFFIDKGFLLNSRELSSLFNFSTVVAPQTVTVEEPRLVEPTPFEKLLLEAQNNLTSKVNSKSITAKKDVERPITTTKRRPMGLLVLTAKAITKAHVGKIATRQTQVPEPSRPQDEEHVIKLH